MTIAEARIFLDLEPDGDPFEAYEEQLFLFKQFFTQRPIVWATFQAKLSKLNKLQQACEVFGVRVPSPIYFERTTYVWSDSIMEAFQNYQQLKSEVFQKIHRSNSPLDLKQQIDFLLEMFSGYCQLWPDTGIDKNELLLSKEPDPMELLSGIKMINADGVINFSDLSKLTAYENNVVIRESMRLYLLSQKELEWRRS